MAEHENGRPGKAATPVNHQGDSNSTRTSPRVIRDELVITYDTNLGRVMHLLPVIPEDAPRLIREGIARRRTAALTGTCPCGATVEHSDLERCSHVYGCPAITKTLTRAIRKWSR